MKFDLKIFSAQNSQVNRAFLLAEGMEQVGTLQKQQRPILKN
jgi:hypothetical protein